MVLTYPDAASRIGSAGTIAMPNRVATMAIGIAAVYLLRTCI